MYVLFYYLSGVKWKYNKTYRCSHPQFLLLLQLLSLQQPLEGCKLSYYPMGSTLLYLFKVMQAPFSNSTFNRTK